MNIHKSYNGHNALNGINLSIKESKITLIVGCTGDGKTIIKKHILGLEKPNKGKVIVCGECVNEASPKQLAIIRSYFGIQFQEGALIDGSFLDTGTVFENIALPLKLKTDMNKKEIENKVNDILETLEIEESKNKHHTKLSGGEIKRVALARALIMNPKILLLDEPTSGIDLRMKSIIYKTIKNKKETLGATVIIITHDLPYILKIADYVAHVCKGIIVFYGTPEEFKKSNVPETKLLVKEMGMI